MKKLSYPFKGLLLLSFCTLTFAAYANAQADGKNPQGTAKMKLNQALLLLQKQYKVTILFEDKAIENFEVSANSVNRKVDIDTKLNSILKPFNLSYRNTKENAYIILPSENKLKNEAGEQNKSSSPEAGTKDHSGSYYAMPVQAAAHSATTESPRQANKIRGIVYAEKGAVLPSVSITLKGTTIVAITDMNGEFELILPAGTEKGILQFSSVGYEQQELPFYNTENITVFLKANSVQLENVVVVGYGIQNKRDVTGSIASVNSKEIKSLPVPDLGQALQGRAAGVQVVSSGSPGSNVTFRIRGVGSTNNSDPLLVIDGVPTDVPLNTISPDDIASVDILKDASAAAIYGSRGANGVVLITTKRGMAGQNNLEFKVFTGVQKATSMIPMLNASQFASLHNEMMANNGQTQNPAYADPVSLGKGTDWLNELFRSAPIQSYSMAYSGGNNQSSYYVSGTVLDQQGIVIHTGYRRYTIQFNAESKVFDWLKFGNNLTLSHDIKRSGSYDIRNTMAALPGQPVFNTDGTYAGPVGQSSWYGDVPNPIGKATLNQNTTKGYNILGNIYGEISLFRSLKFKTMVGVQAQFWDNRNWSPKYNWQPIPQPNSSLSQDYNKSLTWLWDNYFTYTAALGNNHHLNLMAGTSAQNNRKDYLKGSIQDFVSDNVQQMDNGTAQPTIGGSASEWALFSLIGRANYDYKGKYLLTATVRRDASSRFGENYRYGTFPSASVAWRISNEDFFRDVPFVNDLKLRVGYGATGNQNIGEYNFASVLKTIQYNFNGQAVSAVIPFKLPNPNVRWEEVVQTNIGIDASLFNSNVNITLDGYIKNTNNMLVSMSVPVSTGYSDIVVPDVNTGKIYNRGVELTISTSNLRGKLEWNTSLNVSYNKNEVVKLNDSIPTYTNNIGLSQQLSIHSEGHPVNSFYGFVTNGIFQTQAEVDKYAIQVPGDDPYNRTSAGDIRFLDLNNDGRIDDNDRTYIGDPNPSFIFALNNTLAWNGIDLSVFLQGVAGNKIFNANRIYQEGMAVAQNQTTKVLDRWTGEGTGNEMPRAVFNDPNKNSRVSNRFIEDGSYLRIKNVTLGYTFPQSLSRQVKMTAARIYISCQNLLTFTKYTGFDPEVPSNGTDFNVYPVTRTVSAGINITF